MGAPVLDASGKPFGRVKEFAVAPQADAMRVKALVVRRRNAPAGQDPALIPIGSLRRDGAEAELRLVDDRAVSTMTDKDEFLLLERDLLDQQIIDVHGHKVVRVNDVDLFWETTTPGAETVPELSLRIAEVEVGIRGALRRLLKGLPNATVEKVACQVRPSVIPWEFVDLIDRDPARRVRLKIEQEGLAKMHPSDLADILEELAPAEGQALFSSLDEEVAAETLEEVELKTQKQLIESLDSERVAGIIGEMDPGAAADLLSELSDERSDAILEEMSDEQRHEVEELLEYPPDSAAGIMTTDYVAVPATATVAEAFTAIKSFEGDVETIADLYIISAEGEFAGTVPIACLLLTDAQTPLQNLSRTHADHMLSAGLETNVRRVAEVFDKYNLRTLPVLDERRQLAGVINAEHVIAWLRSNR
jgi:flagellar motility protein MotE (MotC chaperone)/sporulation protein YlmC with PRC-barrel domain